MEEGGHVRRIKGVAQYGTLVGVNARGCDGDEGHLMREWIDQLEG